MYKFKTGELFESIRRNEGLSQVEFANSLGVVQSTISKIEKCVFLDVPFSLVSDISTKYNIPVSDFQKGLINKPPKIKNLGVIYFYLTNGFFRAQTLFILCEKIQNSLGINVYKKLKTKRAFFAFEKLRFSFFIFLQIDKHINNDLKEICNNVILQLPKSKSTINLNSSLKIYKNLDISYDEENNFLMTVKLPTEAHINPELFANALILDLSLLVGMKIFENYRLEDNLLILELIHAE